jgi:hypothetical protein
MVHDGARYLPALQVTEGAPQGYRGGFCAVLLTELNTIVRVRGGVWEQLWAYLTVQISGC